ncbi:survival protein sure-like phosphatase/nucleotidase [Dichotomocladium elegans]|nr:survival protein sure-like phosphatase/nucleotidase [Dichotomocladium elegans]
MSDRPLRVLITNDDGPPCKDESPFILPFIEHLESLGWDVKYGSAAPSDYASWISKSFMIKDHIELSYYHRDTGHTGYHRRSDRDFVLLSGTPATCINIALYHIYKHIDFDLVLAGPNFGRNSANIYTLSSGTVGAALESTMCEKKSIALSFAFYSRDFSRDKIQCASVMATNVIQHLYERDKWPKNGLFNVNVPLVNELRPVRLTRFHKTHYGSLFRPLVDVSLEAADKAVATAATAAKQDASGEMAEQNMRQFAEGHESARTVFHFAPDIASMSHPTDPAEDSDAWALNHRYVSGKEFGLLPLSVSVSSNLGCC